MNHDLFRATMAAQELMQQRHAWAERERLIAQLGPRPPAWSVLRQVIAALATVRDGGANRRRRKGARARRPARGAEAAS